MLMFLHCFLVLPLTSNGFSSTSIAISRPSYYGTRRLLHGGSENHQFGASGGLLSALSARPQAREAIEDGDSSNDVALSAGELNRSAARDDGTSTASHDAPSSNSTVCDYDGDVVAMQRAVASSQLQKIRAGDENLDDSLIESETLRPPPRIQLQNYFSQPIVEVWGLSLVLLSSFLQAVNTLDYLPQRIHTGIDTVEAVVVYAFGIDFFLRWWAFDNLRTRYLAKPLVLIDSVVVVLPLLVDGLVAIWEIIQMSGFAPPFDLPSQLIGISSGSALLNLRLLRILKFQRVLTDQSTLTKFQMALGMEERVVRPYQLQLARVVVTVFTLVSVSTGLIYTAEHEVNPEIPDYFTALYFGLTTLTTVGFGDIVPLTTEGRVVVAGSILAGVAIIPAQAASLAEAFLDFQMDKKPTEERKVELSVLESQKQRVFQLENDLAMAKAELRAVTQLKDAEIASLRARLKDAEQREDGMGSKHKMKADLLTGGLSAERAEINLLRSRLIESETDAAENQVSQSPIDIIEKNDTDIREELRRLNAQVTREIERLSSKVSDQENIRQQGDRIE